LDQASDWVAPKEPAVLVFLIQPTQPPVCLAACPVAPGHACLASLLCGELPLPCLVQQWFLAGSCVPADVRAAYPQPFLAGSPRSRLACPQAGADPSTPFVPRMARPQPPQPPQTLEARQAGERKEPASEGGSPAKLGASALLGGLLSEQATAAAESQPSALSPQPVPGAPYSLPVRPPARRTPANHLPGSNTSGHPSKANGSAAWRPSRAPLPALVNGTPPGKERFRFPRSRRRRPTANTSIPAEITRSPGRWRWLSRARPDGVPGAAPTAPAGPRPRTPG